MGENGMERRHTDPWLLQYRSDIYYSSDRGQLTKGARLDSKQFHCLRQDEMDEG